MPAVGRMSPAALVLVVNTGSSSLKYQLVDPASGAWVGKGLVERIGERGGQGLVVGAPAV